MPYSRIREAPESSSAATLRAVVASLNNAWHTPYVSTPWQKRMARYSNYLPESLLQTMLTRTIRKQALDPSLTRYVKTEGLAQQAVNHYNQLDENIGYPAIIIGAPNGAVAYLAALLGVPFLPGHFLLSFADRTDPDDISTYQTHGQQLIEPILKLNSDLLAVNHYDPVHDRFLVKEVNHVRLKLLTLPEAYRKFIQKHLAPGGTILFIDNQFSWSQYKIDERHMFQVGGMGGYTEQDYLQGSEALDVWIRGEGGDHTGGWNLEGWPLESAPESEWGSLPAFKQAAKQFAKQHDFQFRALKGAHPEDFSALVYTAYLWESRLHDRTPQGILVECFSQINPTAALRADLLPLWMPFNTIDSMTSLSRMAPYLPKGLPVGLALTPTFTQTPDMPEALAWNQITQRIGPVRWIGIDPRKYPTDVTALINYLPDLQQWVQENPGQSPAPHLPLEAFLSMIDSLNRHGTKLFTYLLNNEDEQEQNDARETTSSKDYS